MNVINEEVRQDAPSAIWLAVFAAQVQYWSIKTNPFQVPRQWKQQNPDSLLYYMWYRRNVVQVHLLSLQRRRLMYAAIGKAKRLRTIAHKKMITTASIISSGTISSSSINSSLTSSVTPPPVAISSQKKIVRKICSFKVDQSTTCSHHVIISKAKKIVHGTPLLPPRCFQHRFLSTTELETISTYKQPTRYTGYVRLGTSKLPKELNAGNGVFANRHFIKNEGITTYSGVRCSYDEVTAMEKTKQHDYVILPTRTGMHTTSKPYWLGLMEPEIGKGLGSFVNAPYNGAMYAANCSFRYDSIAECIVIYALREILPGEELYMAYARGKRGSRVT